MRYWGGDCEASIPAKGKNLLEGAISGVKSTCEAVRCASGSTSSSASRQWLLRDLRDRRAGRRVDGEGLGVQPDGPGRVSGSRFVAFEDSKEAKAKLQSLGGFAKGMGRRPRAVPKSSDAARCGVLALGWAVLCRQGPNVEVSVLVHRRSGTLALR